MTRPRKGTEKKFFEMLKRVEEGRKEGIKHHKSTFMQCGKFKSGHPVSAFWEKVNCDECISKKD